MDWQRLARANTHPLRVSVLEVLAIDGGRTLSPSDLSHELRVPLSNVNYHVTELAKSGLIELAARRPVRGATEHFYRLADHSNGSNGSRPEERTTGLEPATWTRLCQSSGADLRSGRAHLRREKDLQAIFIREQIGDRIAQHLEVVPVGCADILPGEPGGCRDLYVGDPGHPALGLRVA